MTPSPIRAVFFDVDDTLVDYQYAGRTALRAVLGEYADYDAWLRLDHYDRYLSGELDFQVARDTRMADFLRGSGRESDVADAAEFERQRFALLEHHYRLFDDARPCLEDLRARDLGLGLITNNEPVHQTTKIEAVGLDGLVDVAVISGAIGAAKPDARIFTHACTLLGVEPHEALHVGDNRRADAAGAVDAGLHAAWLDRHGRYDGSAVPYEVVRDLHAVPALAG